MYDKVILPGFKLFGSLDTVTQKEEKEKKGTRRRKLEKKPIDLWGKRKGNSFKDISEHAQEVRCKYLPGNSSE